MSGASEGGGCQALGGAWLGKLGKTFGMMAVEGVGREK